jgi:hypothetical protein
MINVTGGFCGAFGVPIVGSCGVPPRVSVVTPRAARATIERVEHICGRSKSCDMEKMVQAPRRDVLRSRRKRKRYLLVHIANEKGAPLNKKKTKNSHT